MYGGAPKRAAKHTIDAVRPLVSTIQHNYGLPPHFWDHPFVLGFFQFMIGFHATHSSVEPLSTEDRGRAVIDVLMTLSNLNGVALSTQINELVRSDPKNDLFEEGAENAAICAFYFAGKLLRNDRNERVLAEAEAYAERRGQPGDRSTIFEALMLMLYYKRIKELLFSDDSDEAG